MPLTHVQVFCWIGTFYEKVHNSNSKNKDVYGKMQLGSLFQELV